MSWPTNPRPAKALLKLREQVNAVAPNRSGANEGGIGLTAGMLGDAAHQARRSDHNANADGVVLATDITHDPRNGMDAHKLARYMAANPDDRLRYMISNNEITGNAEFAASNPNYGIKRPWTWVPSKENAHTQHAHFSLVHDAAHYDDTRQWNIGVGAADPHAPPVVERPILKVGSRGEEVKALQQLLMVDGIYGHLTEEAVKAFQKARGLDDDGIVGPYTWAELLGPEPHEDDQTWIINIWATTFGGNAETEKSAYDGHRIGENEIGVALPFRFVGKLPKIELRNPTTGEVITADILDVGPWNINDDYWTRGARPQSETGIDKMGRKTNKAGIDLTPGAIRALGYDYNSGWGGTIDWRIKPDPKMVAATQKAITPPQPTFQLPRAETTSTGASNMNDTVWALVRYALISGGTFLAVRYGLLNADQVTSVVDQALPYIGTLISAGSALWGVWVTSQGKRVPLETARRIDVPTINPITGGHEVGPSYTGK